MVCPGDEIQREISVVNSKEKKTVRPFLLPKASHIKHQIEKKDSLLVPWKNCGVLLGRLLDGHAAGFNPQTKQMKPTCTA